mgnify:CR=1 FL=1
MSKKIKLYFDWLNKNETGVIYSKLWSEMKDTFQDGVNRGYGINRIKEYKLLISIIISLSRFRNFINKILDKLFNIVFGLFSLFLTFWIISSDNTGNSLKTEEL